MSSRTEERRAPQSQQANPTGPIAAPGGLGGQVTVRINAQEVTVPLGTTLLQAAKRAGVKIPTLCYHDDLCVAGVCRICVVEVEGQRTLQAACAYPLTAPIAVRTHTRKVRQARRHVLDLLLAEHHGECYTCPRSGNCELQALAREYGVDAFRFGRAETPPHPIDRSSHAVLRDMNKCVLCRRCVRTCIDLQEVGVLEAVGRGDQTHVSTFQNRPLAEVVCISCGQCLNRCPTAALRAHDNTDEVWDAIDDPKKIVVIQTAPSPRAALGECFGLPPGTPMTYQLNTALKRAGFDRVFDTTFAADLTVLEESTELLERLHRTMALGKPAAIPQFTSCSPGWVKYLEHFYPDYLPHLSTAKSPQQMFGALIKTFFAERSGLDPENIVSVSLMPCSAKKFECNRPEMCASGYKDVDFGLTSRELAQMLKEASIDLPSLPGSDFDDPFGRATGSGVIFGATGGVMEAALRTALEFVTGEKIERVFERANVVPVRGFEGIKYAEVPIASVGPVPPLIARLIPNFDWLKGAVLKVAIAHGTANAKRVMEDIKAGGIFSECHFIEFMACPGGCLGGGGQPIPTNKAIREARARALYAEDAACAVRKAHENPAVLEVYRDFLKDGPNGPKTHHLLHTHYRARGKFIG